MGINAAYDHQMFRRFLTLIPLWAGPPRRPPTGITQRPSAPCRERNQRRDGVAITAAIKEGADTNRSAFGGTELGTVDIHVMENTALTRSVMISLKPHKKWDRP